MLKAAKRKVGSDTRYEGGMRFTPSRLEVKALLKSSTRYADPWI